MSKDIFVEEWLDENYRNLYVRNPEIDAYASCGEEVKQYGRQCFRQGQRRERERIVEYAKHQIEIHQEIIDGHDVAPFDWHKGRIKESEALIKSLQNND